MNTHPDNAETPSASCADLTQQLKQAAREFGFQHVGVCPAVTSTGQHALARWLAAGYAGQMHYLSTRQEAYAHPRHLLDGVRSMILLGMNYRTSEPQSTTAGQGRLSRYAWGSLDYHELIHDRMRGLIRVAHDAAQDAHFRGVVDTAPLLEREFAQLAGLGWIGKHTLLLNREAGSWFFLAALLTDLQLVLDPPHDVDHCGTCTACLDACPTAAFPQPYVLDATRCISYLTIELRDPIPRDLRPNIGNWLFGCDICQDVCPWNRRAPASLEVSFQPVAGNDPVDATALLAMDEASFRNRFRKTPLWRAKRRGILRNAAIVLGNRPAASSLDALQHGLSDEEPWVRGASAWALGQHTRWADRVIAALEHRMSVEHDADVLDELRHAHAALCRDNG